MPDQEATIVVVDDTPENLHLLTDMLTEEGYRVRLAPNGERALATIQKEPPDMVLLDILMPQMDGFEVCRRLKADESLRDIPVIFISALDELFDKVTAFSVGGVDYIKKPFQIEEVLARVHTHLTLREMRQQLHAQNQELEAFAHTVAHDLKSPLSILIGFLDLMRFDEDDLPDSAVDLLDKSMQSAHRMNNIINELLLLATVRSEAIELSPVHMGDVVDQALDRLGQMTEEYAAEIDIQGNWPLVLGYAPWLEEVWVNYLSNGLKYGGEPPRLELGAMAQDNGMTRFWVRDNGGGLSQEDQDRLFTEFTRLDKLRAQGHGLGLSIVRRIMDKLGGEVGVESSPNEGSLFYFTLPTVREAEPAL